jgi:hypothetical protein
MKIFISWSGEKARRVALSLKAFLQDVNQRIIAWFSDSDIKAGERWALELATRLESTNFGIICVTQEGLHSPWVLFEAGALAKLVSGSRVCPYLIDVTKKQLDGPLSQFQSKEATRDQTWEMLQAINIATNDDALPEERLRKYFDTFWPDLEKALSEVNRDLRPLPRELRGELLDLLPKMMYRTAEIEMPVAFADISRWDINWNQAAIYVWREVIQVAADERKLTGLLDVLLEMRKDYDGVAGLQELAQKIRVWEGSPGRTSA